MPQPSTRAGGGDATATPALRGENASDVAFTLLAVVGLALAAVGLRRELSAAPSVATAATIAVVDMAVGAAKRRVAAGLVWDRVHAGEALGRGDGLFVPADALVEVVFTDGSRLTVEESSLVVIDDGRSERPRVHLRGGGVNLAAAAAPIAIEARDWRAELGPSSAAHARIIAIGFATSLPKSDGAVPCAASAISAEGT